MDYSFNDEVSDQNTAECQNVTAINSEQLSEKLSSMQISGQNRENRENRDDTIN